MLDLFSWSFSWLVIFDQLSRHCEFYLARCWVFLFRIQLFRNSLILLDLAFFDLLDEIT